MRERDPVRTTIDHAPACCPSCGSPGDAGSWCAQGIPAAWHPLSFRRITARTLRARLLGMLADAALPGDARPTRDALLAALAAVVATSPSFADDSPSRARDLLRVAVAVSLVDGVLAEILEAHATDASLDDTTPSVRTR